MSSLSLLLISPKLKYYNSFKISQAEGEVDTLIIIQIVWVSGKK